MTITSHVHDYGIETVQLYHMIRSYSSQILMVQSNRDFAKVVLKRARKYYARNRISICTSKRRRYNLAEPKPCVKEQYVLTAKKALLHNNKVMKKLVKYFKSQQEGAFEEMNKCSRMATIAQIAAHRLIAKALQIRK